VRVCETRGYIMHECWALSEALPLCMCHRSTTHLDAPHASGLFFSLCCLTAGLAWPAGRPQVQNALVSSLGCGMLVLEVTRAAMTMEGCSFLVQARLCSINAAIL
jgi:hypothetical protein